MIILDTNVISETQKPQPDSRVMAWLDSLDPTSTYLTSITVAELLYGVDLMPKGKRRAALEGSVVAMIEQDFYGRILPFDATAAYHFGKMVSGANQSGVAVSFPDGAIAAIARGNNYGMIATRDVTPFRAMRLDVINPWESAAPSN